MDEELIEGRLCEKGYLREYYDETKQDLVRVMTEKGVREARKLLKDPKWRRIAFFLMASQGWSETEIRKFLNGKI